MSKQEQTEWMLYVSNKHKNTLIQYFLLKYIALQLLINTKVKLKKFYLNNENMIVKTYTWLYDHNQGYLVYRFISKQKNNFALYKLNQTFQHNKQNHHAKVWFVQQIKKQTESIYYLLALIYWYGTATPGLLQR